MELAQQDEKNKLIYQHNAITSGRYDYSACMLDVLFMVLASLEQNKLEYTIYIKDIEDITGRKWNTTQLIETTGEMLTKMFTIGDPEKLDTEDYIQFVLFQYFKFHKGEKAFTTKLAEKALPLFFELKNNFTVLQLKSVLNCSSKYAKRLYAIGCQWRNVGTKKFEILELKNMLGMVDKKGNETYKQISQFKEFVLDLSMQQINQNTDINMSYEFIKRGRSFKYINFYINVKPPKQLEIDFNESVENQKYKSKIMAYGLTEDQAKAIVTAVKEKHWDIEITKINQRIRQGKLKVKNAAAYLVGVYQKKGIIPIQNN